MAPKIEKVWGSVFGTTAVQRKEPKNEDLPQDRKQKDERDEEQEEARHADRESVEKAIVDLKAEPSFAGLLIQMLQKPDGEIAVSFKQPNGTVVRTMTGDEFLKLRDASIKGKEGRGKILDQKF